LGLVRVRVILENPVNHRRLETLAIVDTGASYTIIPSRVDERLGGLPRSGRRVRVKTAKGEDVLEEAMALVELEGEKGFTPVLVSASLDEVLIGLLTLEAFGLKVDPITGRLEKTPIYLL